MDDIETAAEWLYRFDTRRRRGLLYIRWEELPRRTQNEWRMHARHLLEDLASFRAYKEHRREEEREIWSPPAAVFN